MSELTRGLLWGGLQALAVLAIAPLLEGVVRKLRAKIHSRKGPPIIQPYLDLLKLLGKEDLRVTRGGLQAVAPVVFLSAILMAAAVAPVLAPSTLGPGDLVVFVYFLGLAAAALVFLGFLTGSPFSAVGASREMMLTLTAEPAVVFSLLVLALRAKSLTFAQIIQAQQTPHLSSIIAAVAYLLALQVLVAKVPFDIAEAEQEIMDGPLTEVSGPSLALCKWGLYAKQALYLGVFVQLFLPWSVASVSAWLQPILSVVFLLVLNLVLVGITMSVHPRLRVDQAMRYIGAVLVVSLVALAYAVMGT